MALEPKFGSFLICDAALSALGRGTRTGAVLAPVLCPLTNQKLFSPWLGGDSGKGHPLPMAQMQLLYLSDPAQKNLYQPILY